MFPKRCDSQSRGPQACRLSHRFGLENAVTVAQMSDLIAFLLLPQYFDSNEDHHQTLPAYLSGLFHKYAHVRGNGFWAEARRERRAYPAVDL